MPIWENHPWRRAFLVEPLTLRQLSWLANTRSPEAPAAANIYLHVSPRPANACVQLAHGPARLYVSQPLLSDKMPAHLQHR